jgi:hypothetical protein
MPVPSASCPDFLLFCAALQPEIGRKTKHKLCHAKKKLAGRRQAEVIQPTRRFAKKLRMGLFLVAV